MITGMVASAARVRSLALGCALLAWSVGASAELCKGIPDCQPQTMSAVRYGPLDTKGYAYYCSGERPFYWNPDTTLGLFGHNFRIDNGCFTVSENPFAEDQPDKFDATITNWCAKHETLTITIGCSSMPQTVACTTNALKVTKDPACPMVAGTYKNFCSPGPIPACVQVWQESCSTGPAYCTDDLTGVWCYTCQP